MAILWLGFAVQIALVVLIINMLRVGRATAASVHHAILQQAELELDSCIDRVLMTGGKISVSDVATKARNLLSGPSERALKGKYAEEYDQTVSKRVEARRR